jgi:hypothetical protein
MANIVRASLPTFNALTDPDKDHYSLFADEDDVLIKEFARGAVTFNSTDYPSGYEITHNLGYVPMFLAFVNGGAFFGAPAGWQQVGNGNLSIAYAAYATDTKLVLYTGGGNTDFVYYIFYDNQVGNSGISVPLVGNIVTAAKNGVSALSDDPNDFIYRSDLNTFKILKEGVETLHYTGDGTYNFSHGLSLTSPSAFITYFMFPDGSITMGGGTFMALSRDKEWEAASSISTTQIKTRIFGDGTTQDIKVKYYIFESPLGGSSGVTINPQDSFIRVGKDGKNALTSTDPDDFFFLSALNTLKYYYSDSVTVPAVGSGSDVFTLEIVHGLGYPPLFVAYTDFAGGYNIVPYITSTLPLGNRQSSVYVDSNKIYFEINITEFPGHPIIYNFTKTFYFKIYRNNLGL